MSIFQAHPELWEDVGPLPVILDPEHPDGPRDFAPGAPGKPTDYVSEAEKQRAVASANNGNHRALLLGGPMSRCTLHIDDLGWTSWIAVIRGTKLFHLWPADVDRAATFAFKDGLSRHEDGSIYLSTKFDPFREQSPEMEAMFEETGRSYGDELWDWEARDAFSPQRSTPLPPVKPAECIVKAGEMFMTWDNWHTALNLEASLAVGRSYIDKWGLPLLLWRSMVYRPNFGAALELTANVLKRDTAGKTTFFDALKVVRDLSANARDSGSDEWPRAKAVHAARAAEVESTLAEAGEIFREVAAASLRALVGDAELTDEGLDALAARVAAAALSDEWQNQIG